MIFKIGAALIFLFFTTNLFCFVASHPHDQVATVGLGDSCSSNERCSANVDSSWCYVPSPTCGAGYCDCQPGFVQVFNRSGCFAARQLGEKCSRERDVCSESHSECFNGVCTCSSGYTRFGTICVSEIKHVRAGGKCFDTVQCVGNLVCVDNKCGCYPEYALSGIGDCVRKMYGDQCTLDSDCIHSSNTVCKQGMCACDSRSNMVSYISMSQKTHTRYNVAPVKCVVRSACLPDTSQIGNEGDVCSEPDPKDPSAPFKICKQPFVCTPCTSYKKVCAIRPAGCFRIMAARNDAITSAAAAFVVGALAIGALISLIFEKITN